jgi:hypothetical protein
VGRQPLLPADSRDGDREKERDRDMLKDMVCWHATAENLKNRSGRAYRKKNATSQRDGENET